MDKLGLIKMKIRDYKTDLKILEKNGIIIWNILGITFLKDGYNHGLEVIFWD